MPDDAKKPGQTWREQTEAGYDAVIAARKANPENAVKMDAVLPIYCRFPAALAGASESTLQYVASMAAVALDEIKHREAERG